MSTTSPTAPSRRSFAEGAPPLDSVDGAARCVDAHAKRLQHGPPLPGWVLRLRGYKAAPR